MAKYKSIYTGAKIDQAVGNVNQIVDNEFVFADGNGTNALGYKIQQYITNNYAPISTPTFSGKVTATNGLEIQSLLAPATSGSSSHTAGTSGQILTSNGTSVYWSTRDWSVLQANGEWLNESRVVLFSEAYGPTSRFGGVKKTFYTPAIYVVPKEGKLHATTLEANTIVPAPNSGAQIGTSATPFIDLYCTDVHTSSDRRLKDNIADLQLNSLEVLKRLNIKEYLWKNAPERGTQIGVIAQELQQILPEKYRTAFLGGSEKEGEYLSIQDNKLVYLLIDVVQKQQTQIEELQEQINALKKD